MTFQEFLDSVAALFGEDDWPKPLHLLRALQFIDAGADPVEAARRAHASPAAVRKAQASADPVQAAFGLGLHEVDDRHRRRATQILGQLLLGRCAEIAFESIYKAEMHTEELELRDLREGRTDTDYRVYNGQGRPIYRINIKFHGASFRRAPEMVGLEPPDCFALATYKIHSALEKQRAEALPYFFAIVGVRELTGESVGRTIPSALVDTVAFIDQAPRGRNKRDFEDAVVSHLMGREHAVFLDTLARIKQAEWYVLSAKRADRLLRELLFQRAYALRVRNFTRVFGGAEVDMHFSLRNDLIPLHAFLRTLREEGPQKITTLLERGDY